MNIIKWTCNFVQDHLKELKVGLYMKFFAQGPELITAAEEQSVVYHLHYLSHLSMARNIHVQEMVIDLTYFCEF